MTFFMVCLIVTLILLSCMSCQPFQHLCTWYCMEHIRSSPTLPKVFLSLLNSFSFFFFLPTPLTWFFMELHFSTFNVTSITNSFCSSVSYFSKPQNQVWSHLHFLVIYSVKCGTKKMYFLCSQKLQFKVKTRQQAVRQENTFKLTI